MRMDAHVRIMELVLPLGSSVHTIDEMELITEVQSNVWQKSHRKLIFGQLVVTSLRVFEAKEMRDGMPGVCLSEVGNRFTSKELGTLTRKPARTWNYPFAWLSKVN